MPATRRTTAATTALAAALAAPATAPAQCDPAPLGAVETTNDANKAAVLGSLVYAANGRGMTPTNSTDVIDVSDPNNPAVITSLPQGTGGGLLKDVCTDGSRLFVQASSMVYIYTLDDPEAPAFASLIDTQGAAMNIEARGDLLYVGARVPTQLLIYSVKDPAAPVLLGAAPGAGTLAAARDVALDEDDIVYLGDEGTGVRVISVADPADPQVLDTFNPGFSVSASQVRFLRRVGDTLFVTFQNGAGLEAWDISTPTSATLAGSLAVGSGPLEDIQIAGDTAYLCDGAAGVITVDVSDPTSMSIDGGLTLPGMTAMGIAVSGASGYLAASDDLTVLDLSSCVLLGDLNGDGVVDSSDLGILLAAWGATGHPADLDGDGVVGSGDLGILLAAWT